MNLNPLIVKLLQGRGITHETDMMEFLSPKPQKTYDPFLLPHMEAGVDLILSETKKASRIWVYGDYDADGITSVTLMMSLLSKLTDKDKLKYYIPSRFEEGYGLNMEAIDYIASQGCDLLITVDCGSVSYEEVERAKSLGMKVLVTDHHNITDSMADCPLINPKHPESKYPFKELSGCGVAFKLAQAIQQRAGLAKGILTEVLDLVAIGTVGDIMPLLDENRTMVKFGMKVINACNRPGLKKLIEGTSLKLGQISSENISFVIVPHLNASGRIEDASQAVELLLGDCDQGRMDQIVEDILSKNIQRRQLQAQLFDKCQETVDREQEKNPSGELPDIIILEADSTHEGIAGIVAGKLKETFYRPAIILSPTGPEDSYLKGTGRSVEGINLYELLKTQEHLFEKFGGHKGACGFSMEKEHLAELKAGLAKELEIIKSEDSQVFVKKHPVELWLKASDLTLELAEQLDMLAPFGNKNPRPLILCQAVTLRDIKYMGDKQQHARFVATGDEGNGVQCVLFGKAQDYHLSGSEHQKTSLIGNLECQVWQGAKRLQFRVDEIEFDEPV